MNDTKICNYFDGGTCINDEEFPNGTPTEITADYCNNQCSYNKREKNMENPKIVWEVKLKSGRVYSNKNVTSIDYSSGLAKFNVLIRPKKTEKRIFWIFTWDVTVEEEIIQTVFVVPLDNIDYIQLKTIEEEKKNA